MTRALPRSFRCAAALLALAAPLAAQTTPGGFSLPEPTPTPAPAPAGPADERAGVVIPPRATATPRIVPAPVLTEERPSAPATPAPSPSPRPPRPSAATPAPQAAPSPRPSAQLPAPPPSDTTGAPVLAPDVATPSAVEAPPAPVLTGPTLSIQTPPAPRPAETTAAPGTDLADWSAIDWRWLAGGAALLLGGLGALVAWRRARRRGRVLRLAPPVADADTGLPPALPRIAVTLDIPGATRSLMTFTLRYRLTLANRSERAVNHLAVAVHLASAQRDHANAAPVAQAHKLAQIDRIGPHQSRSITGEVQLPLAQITPVMQGRTALFIPLLHVTLEGEDQSVMVRSFVIGVPGSGTEGRVRPLPLAMPPGSIPALKARAIAPAPAPLGAGARAR